MQTLYRILFIGLFSISSAHANSFDGYYGSVALGWMQGDISINSNYREEVVTTTTLTGHSPYSVDLTNAALLGGIALGVETSMKERYLIGVEARANFENINTTSNVDISSNTIIPGDITIADESIQLHVKAKRDFNLLVRLGFLLQPNVLIYTMVGPSTAYFQESAAIGNTDSDGFVLSFNTNESGYKLGWVAGIGLDYLIGKNFSLALEYAHADYGKLPSLEGTTTTVISTTTYQAFLDTDVYAKSNTVSFRASYHFG